MRAALSFSFTEDVYSLHSDCLLCADDSEDSKLQLWP